jgi:hypothetical protein
MSDTTCNGWKNYETWRVHLEICDGMLQSMLEDAKHGSFDFLDNFHTARFDLADYLKNACEEIVCEFGDADTLAKQYAVAFLSRVNWFEIADNFLTDNPDICPKADN